MHIFQEKAGIISENPIWVCICNDYIYTADTIENLISILNNEWEDDKHLVG